jgi:AraC-like DNA-binding protein
MLDNSIPMATPIPSVAATSTLAMVCTAEARGIDTADLLATAGLNRVELEDPDLRIPAPVVLSIWHSLRERAADPALQLIAPTSLPFGAYRVIDYLVGASATVGEGVRRFARFFHLITEAATLEVESDGEEYCLHLATPGGGAVPPVYVDYVFAALTTRIRMRICTDLCVKRVELRQSEPAQRAPYDELFAAQIEFGAAQDRLCFSREQWEAPIESADAALAHLLEEHARILAQRVSRGTAGFSTDVERAIAAAPLDAGSMVDVARALHMSVRTLQRRLVASGTTFRKLSEDVRAQLAQGYLADATVSIAEVAFLLGFSDQSSFHRAFRRWTGESPGRWRRRRVRKLA